MNPPFIRPMPGRNPADHHRAATPLELFFDLISVIAIAAAASGLHHAIAENHVGDGIIKFVVAFWSIWWAWMNFTWFASAYDNDDAPYRIATLIMMVGALIMAAGIPEVFKTFDWTLGLVGYIVMRLSLCWLWFRAARHDPERRLTALRYGWGVALCQVLWVLAYFFVPQSYFLLFMVFGFACELSVPAYAERAAGTPWHPHHIVERYGLLTIIVLGESLLAVANGVRLAAEDSHSVPSLLLLIAGGLLIVFTMWWLYFNEDEHVALNQRNVGTGFLWGYGHLVIFGSIAAVGAGLAVCVDYVTHHAEISFVVANASVSIPTAIFLMGLWFIHDQFSSPNKWKEFTLAIVTVAVVLAATYFEFGVLAIGLIMTAYLVIKLRKRGK